VFTVPTGEPADTTGLAGLIVIVNVPDPLPPALVAVAVIVNEPAAVGVPLITPVVVFNVKPAGNAVEL